MNILSIAYYTAIKYRRNFWVIIAFILTTILCVYVMGAMFDNKPSVITTKEKVGFFSLDTGKVIEQLKTSLHSEIAAESIMIVAVSSLEDGIGKVEKGELDAFIFVDRDFSEKIGANEKSVIHLYHAQNIYTANLLIDSFVNSFNGSAAAVKIGGTPDDNDNSDNLVVTRIVTKGKTPSQKDMISIASILIVTFYGSLLGSHSLLSDWRRHTYIRSRCAPIRSIESFTGRLLGNISIMFVCTIISALLIKFVLKVSLGGNLLILILALLLFLLITISFGVLLARLLRNIYLCGLVTFAVNFSLVYPVMANAFLPGISTSFDILRLISPHYHTYQVIIGTTFPGTADVAGSIAILAIIAAVLSGSALMAERRIGR